MTASDAAKRWGMTYRYVRKLCCFGRITGATFDGYAWHIPDDYVYDRKRKSNHKHTALMDEECMEIFAECAETPEIRAEKPVEQHTPNLTKPSIEACANALVDAYRAHHPNSSYLLLQYRGGTIHISNSFYGSDRKKPLDMSWEVSGYANNT